MEQKSRDNSYDVIESKSGHHVPVINGLHLHSPYDPIKETESFINKNKSLLNYTNNILVLGLGFGYHLQAIAEVLEKRYQNNYTIYVIEPNEKIFEDLKTYNPISNDNIKIIQEDDCDKLYQNTILINFLTQKPGILFHPASFNLNDTFFKKYLNYHAKKEIGEYIGLIEHHEIKEYLSKFDLNLKINDIYDHIKNKTDLEYHELDFFFSALEQIN